MSFHRSPLNLRNSNSNAGLTTLAFTRQNRRFSPHAQYLAAEQETLQRNPYFPAPGQNLDCEHLHPDHIWIIY